MIYFGLNDRQWRVILSHYYAAHPQLRNVPLASPNRSLIEARCWFQAKYKDFPAKELGHASK